MFSIHPVAVATAVLAGVLGSVLPLDTTAGSAATPSASDSALTRAVRAQMAAATSRSWAVVVDVAGKGRVVTINGGRSYQPASTQKLFTTLPLLLEQPARQLVTAVAASALPSRGVLRGDLVVQASGDPTLRAANLVRLARAVHAAGVRRVTGDLVLDIGTMSTSRGRAGWKSSYVPGEVGPLSPFAVGADQVSGRAGYLHNPTAGNLLLMRKKLNAAGVTILGSSRVERNVAAGNIFASHASATIGSIVRTTLVESNNFYAEQLLTVEGGRATVDRVTRDAGVSGTSYATDGSGLSYSDRQSAAGEATLLGYASGSSAAASMMSSLPVACRTGTLVHLLCGSRAAGQVFAKTGTLDHAKALTGYTTDALGRRVTFAILTGGDRSTSRAMRAIEKVVYLLRAYSS